MDKNPIVVIAAMDAEFKLLKEKLENVTVSTINQYTFYEGTIQEYPVVICNCLIMSINAAVATTLAIQKYNPLVIINEGTAGRTWIECT